MDIIFSFFIYFSIIICDPFINEILDYTFWNIRLACWDLKLYPQRNSLYNITKSTSQMHFYRDSQLSIASDGLMQYSDTMIPWYRDTVILFTVLMFKFSTNFLIFVAILIIGGVLIINNVSFLNKYLCSIDATNESISISKRSFNFGCRINRSNNSSISRCQLHFARYVESMDDIAWILGIQHPSIILNVGYPLNRSFCEYPSWSNVGREAFQYISFILDHYEHPHQLGEINIFCQSVPNGITISEFQLNVERICPISSTLNLRDGFAFMGESDYQFKNGWTDFPRNYAKVFKHLFNSSILHPVPLRLFFPFLLIRNAYLMHACIHIHIHT